MTLTIGRYADKLTKEQKERLKPFDSRCLVGIPQPEIVNYYDYKRWLLGMEQKWMKEFNGDKHYYAGNLGDFNSESRISGIFNGVYLNSKFYRYDGTLHSEFADDFRSKRGLLIRDHYSPDDVIKVHLITDNLEDFLKQEGIEYKRTNFERK